MPENTDSIQAVANTVRVLSAAMVEKAKSGHPGGPMGAADFISVLYTEFLDYDPDDTLWPLRDRFFLDAGHMSPMLYSILTLTGRMELSDLEEFRQWGSKTPGHPEVDKNLGIENTSGPLGQGHVYGVGAAIAERFLSTKFGDWMAHNIYLFISDGGIQEEISQGAGRIAGHLGLSNITMFYDSNKIQLSTKTNAVTEEDTAAKYRAWGWKVIDIDGNDVQAIRQALAEAKAEKEKPTLIIGNTVMGKGALTAEGESFEDQVSTHGQPLSNAGGSVEDTIKSLGGDPENPFVIPDTVKDFVAAAHAEKSQFIKERKKAEQAWRQANPELAKELDSYLSGEAPKLDWQAIYDKQKTGVATRASSSVVLGEFAEQIPNMIVMSADLSNSDKTDGFLKKTAEIKRNSFTGQFLQCGVSEFTMACLANGMALHGGIIPVCATFFAFSDYMKPALRMAALMELPVKFMWTHDAFRVGEDGPTHQPIEQETQLRLLEKVHNHSEKPGFLVLRPADAAETTAAWQLALENTTTPTGLILTRQDVDELPALGKSRYAEAVKGSAKGAYIVKDTEQPDLVVIANGSEVATAVEGAQALEKSSDYKIRVVSVISEGRFREQDESYQESILPEGIPRFGITAGLKANLVELVGTHGGYHSLEHFGFSAPYKVLDEKFGFTPESIADKLKQWLERS